MSALQKVKDYAVANGKSIADLQAMGKNALVAAAGLTFQESGTLGKAIKRYKAQQEKETSDAKLLNITTRIQNGTLPAQPTATVEEIEAGISYKVVI